MSYERQNRIPRRIVQDQPMPAEAWSDHEDANAQFESADREFFPWLAAALGALVGVVSFGLSLIDWT